MYSPVPIENAPATSAAAPVSTIACAETPPPPTPAISEALVTRPSTAPNTVGRSQPPDTSRCPCDHPAPSAAAPVAWEGSRACSLPTPRLSPASGRALIGHVIGGSAPPATTRRHGRPDGGAAVR